MKEIEIEKLRQLVSRTDMSGNQKVDWLVNFINEREQALRIHDVSESVCELCNGTEIFNPFEGMELPCPCSIKIVEQTVR